MSKKEKLSKTCKICKIAYYTSVCPLCNESKHCISLSEIEEQSISISDPSLFDIIPFAAEVRKEIDKKDLKQTLEEIRNKIVATQRIGKLDFITCSVPLRHLKEIKLLLIKKGYSVWSMKAAGFPNSFTVYW